MWRPGSAATQVVGTAWGAKIGTLESFVGRRRGDARGARGSEEWRVSVRLGVCLGVCLGVSLGVCLGVCLPHPSTTTRSTHHRHARPPTHTARAAVAARRDARAQHEHRRLPRRRLRHQGIDALTRNLVGVRERGVQSEVRHRRRRSCCKCVASTVWSDYNLAIREMTPKHHTLAKHALLCQHSRRRISEPFFVNPSSSANRRHRALVVSLSFSPPETHRARLVRWRGGDVLARRHRVVIIVAFVPSSSCHHLSSSSRRCLAARRARRLDGVHGARRGARGGDEPALADRGGEHAPSERLHRRGASSLFTSN